MANKNLLQAAGDGTAVPTGYVGETSSIATWNSSYAIGVSNLATLTLNKGVWLVMASGSVNTATFRLRLSISTNSATIDTTNDVTSTGFTGNQPNGQAVFKFVVISADNTPVYAVGQSYDGTVTASGRIQAVRIA